MAAAFIDKARITVRAGKGGNGAVAVSYTHLFAGTITEPLRKDLGPEHL